MNNKKGISAIVATVLIILITVAAVTIIWAAIIPMISTQLSKGTVCLDAVSQVTLKDGGYTCYDATAGTVSLQISRGAKNFQLADIQILVSDGGSTTSHNVTDDSAVTPTAVPGVNEERVYIITGVTAADGVQIAPIVGVGSTEDACDVSSTKVLRAC